MMPLADAIAIARKAMLATGDLIYDGDEGRVRGRTIAFKAFAEAYNRLLNDTLSDDPDEPETVSEEPSNVVRIAPDMRTPDEDREAARDRTLEMLDIVNNSVEAGNYLDFVIILGVDEGRQDITGVATMFTLGAIENISMFMGGLELAKQDLIRVHDEQFEEDSYED
jgi:hypothetical protein